MFLKLLIIQSCKKYHLQLLTILSISFYKTEFQPFIPFDAVWLDLLLLGVVLLLVLVYRPQGLIPEKTTPTVEHKVK